MEFKLNKIDTEIRQKINDSTKEGLIHRKQQPLINKDKKNQREHKFEDSLKKHSQKDKNKGKMLSVEAEKVEEIKVEAFMDKEEKDKSSGIFTGRFLDIKR